ncbi:MAG: penicillin-binding transpeptidase domain-containing protein [Gammaproteobacteria bacterium]|nr:penicillin-binding transpeptidase domain-containing protein [Gammaproteobacteria bacterium]
MKKIIFVLFLSLMTTISVADTVDYPTYFAGKSACFILFDLNKNKLLTEYNSSRCKEQIPPDSTFKVPLSLMAFDQKLITQQTVFKWDGKEKGLSFWDQDQTPHTWLMNSVVWVSQEITPKLGMDKIKNYLKLFQYGNQDFTGDPGENNGLTHAWLESSLTISGDEQFAFLKKLVMNALPVSQEAMTETKANMYLETSPNGWKLYGKTGSGPIAEQPANVQHYLEDGWAIGYVQKADQIYVFVLNLTDFEQPKTSEQGGTRAKNIVKAILTKMGLY